MPNLIKRFIMTNRFLLLVSALLLAGAGCTGGNTDPGAGNQQVETRAGYLPTGAVFPTTETIESGEYRPLSRPLFLYVRTESLKKPAVVALLEYFLSDEATELVNEVGYLNLNATQLAAARKVLSDAVAAAGTSTAKNLSGEVQIDGSSTVYPITQAVAEEFSKMHRGVRVPVGVSGTGGGFKKFYAGEIDITDASRPINETEIEECRKHGIEYISFPIAIDGLTVVVNPQNHWVSGLTVEELRRIWEPESQIKRWSDLNPEFPNNPITLFGPDTDSGTFDYFTEEVMGKAGQCRSDYQQSADDNFLVTGVHGDKNALGYFGYAYYIENKDKVKALAIAPASNGHAGQE